MGVLQTLRKSVREARDEWDNFNRVIAETPEILDRVGTGGGGRRPLDRQTGGASFSLPPGTVLGPNGQPVGSAARPAGVITTSSPARAGVRTTADPGVEANATVLVRPIGGTGPSYSVEFLAAVGEPGTFTLPSSGQVLEGWYLAGSFYPVPPGAAAAGGRSSGGGAAGGSGGRRRRPGVRGPQALDRSRDYVGPGGRVIREGDGGGNSRATGGSTVAVDRMRVDLGSKIDQLTAAVKQQGSFGDLLRRQA